MVVVVLPMFSFVCSISFSSLSFLTLNSTIVDVNDPLVFLWMPSVPMFCFFSSASIPWVLRLAGI